MKIKNKLKQMTVISIIVLGILIPVQGVADPKIDDARFAQMAADRGLTVEQFEQAIIYTNIVIKKQKDRWTYNWFINQRARQGDREAILRVVERNGMSRSWAERIIIRESGFDPGAYNHTEWPPGTGNHAAGVFQLLTPQWDYRYSPICRQSNGRAKYWDAVCNIDAAAVLYHTEGPSVHW